jgi:hypothetical protein
MIKQKNDHNQLQRPLKHLGEGKVHTLSMKKKKYLYKLRVLSFLRFFFERAKDEKINILFYRHAG